MIFSRRRFLTITATATAVTMAGRSHAVSLYRWQGSALGARASITLNHPEAARITDASRAEIDRLEDIFSLYRADSALSRLNAAGHLDAPPFELLECLSLAALAHRVTGGLFDPTVQPLWALYAEAHAGGQAPSEAQIEAVLARGDWGDVRYDATSIRLLHGMALTLNGIAQGYIADRVATLLKAEGLSDVLIDTGEQRAIGRHPQGGDWPVTLDDPEGTMIGLHDRSLASSDPLGTVFDAAGTTGHILDPRTGRPAMPHWQLVSVSAASAAMADALSTAICLMTRDEALRTIVGATGAKLVHLSART